MDLRDSRRKLAERTREAEEALPKEVRLPGGWIREITPGGVDLYRPKSLPHNRHPLAHEFVIRWWMIAWCVMMLGAIGLAWYWL